MIQTSLMQFIERIQNCNLCWQILCICSICLLQICLKSHGVFFCLESGNCITTITCCAYVQFPQRWLWLSQKSLFDSALLTTIYINKKLSYRREKARSFMSLNISLCYSRSLKVIGNDNLENGVNPY